MTKEEIKERLIEIQTNISTILYSDYFHPKDEIEATYIKNAAEWLALLNINKLVSEYVSQLEDKTVLGRTLEVRL